VGKGSVMSVFRYGLVGPNFQPNLLSERAPYSQILSSSSLDEFVTIFEVWAC